MASPKLRPNGTGAQWYDYYAGYSEAFVRDALLAAGCKPSSVVLDPWNGSGTTTSVAHRSGYRSIGVDANPVAVVVARARLLDGLVRPSVDSLLADLLDHASRLQPAQVLGPADPLLHWFGPSTAKSIRAFERSIHRVLVDESSDRDSPEAVDVSTLSTLAAFYYVALFHTVRSLTRQQFVGSNPTWLRHAQGGERRVGISAPSVWAKIREAVHVLASSLDPTPSSAGSHDAQILLGDASTLNELLEPGSANLILTSPPYCTRIDYVVATSSELAVLNYGDNEIRSLRNRMLGTPTIVRSDNEIPDSLPSSCRDLLWRISQHPSRASGTYYLKYYLQYMTSMAASLASMSEVASGTAIAFFVVQDSYYKDIHVDLASILGDMAAAHGWTRAARYDFRIPRTKAGINRASQRYRRGDASAVESALVLSR